MSVYVIDFSEPRVTGFTIAPGSYNGPGGGQANTPLRLYGRGATEWGEGVNEDLVRITENFASASPPPNPINGQMWLESKIYHFNNTSYYRYDAGVWTLMNPQPSVVVSLPASGTVGQYVVVSGVLYGWYIKSPISVGQWHARSFSTGATPPTTPEQILKSYDGYSSTWGQPRAVVVATVAPALPTTGTLWYDQTTSTLKVYDAATSTWKPVVTTGTAVTGALDMNSNKITNLANATAATDALNMQTADGRYVNVTGDTMTGALVLSGDPTLALHAATKQYVDTQVSAVSTTISSAITAYSNPVGVFTYKAGDVAIFSGKIYIALISGTTDMTSSNWKQVWPATYS